MNHASESHLAEEKERDQVGPVGRKGEIHPTVRTLQEVKRGRKEESGTGKLISVGWGDNKIKLGGVVAY